jgi:chorismate dehydratase
MAQNNSEMMPVTVSAVSYLNTVPFLHGLKQSAIAKSIRLSLSPPAGSAALFEAGETDVSLLPVAAIPHLSSCHFISDYCIGASGAVRTVVLLSNTPLPDIHTIYLDPHSRTSIVLVQILAKYFWNIAPAFRQFDESLLPLKTGESCVLIGDKVFACEAHYTHRYDLAEAWMHFTGKPFVFAAWVSREKLDTHFVSLFNEALHYGITHIHEALAAEAVHFDAALAEGYLTHNIDYAFDTAKRQGMELFWQLLRDAGHEVNLPPHDSIRKSVNL